MLFRSSLLPTLLVATLSLSAQNGVQQGKPFSRVIKNAQGDLLTVVDGLLDVDGRALLYVEEGLVHKVVRLDAQLQPTQELALKDQVFDGLKWNGICPMITGGEMKVLFASNQKKGVEFGIGAVNASGAVTITGFKRVATFDQPMSGDLSTTLSRRPLPDPILFSRGLAFAQQERLVASPDGQHFLLNLFSQDTKGNKRFWYACMGSDLSVQWSGMKELPYDDVQSTVHQVSLADNGDVHLITYVFKCKSEEQLSDKLCHEVHLTTLTDQGNTVKDLLLDKDFVSTVRLCERGSGKVSLAIRYGALTGLPGVLLTFDPKDAKLKPTPVVDQRIPGIRKVKLTTFGAMEGDKKPSTARNTKVPNEIIELLPAWDGGTVLVETFLENNFELPIGEAIAIRHLSGAVRASSFDASDTLRWNHVADRAYMTTAGQAFETAGFALEDNGLTLVFGHTPKGLEGILALGSAPEQETKDKKAKGATTEPGVLKAVMLDRSGKVVNEGTALRPEAPFVACPMELLTEPTGHKALVRCFDRGTQYSYALIDLSAVGKE
jgi:hypothetical protein